MYIYCLPTFTMVLLKVCAKLASILYGSEILFRLQLAEIMDGMSKEQCAIKSAINLYALKASVRYVKLKNEKC